MKISPSYLRFYVTLMATLLAFSLRDILAQDLGELARQERARKLARQTRVTKVFTNEDLKRDVIISDEERAALAQQQTPPAGETATALAENASPPAPSEPVAIHLKLAAPAIPSKEIAAPAKHFAERAVPTVPLWPTAMPLGDIARYYRQQVVPQLPSMDDAVIAEALAHAPMLRDFAADKLQMTFALPAAPVAPAPAPAARQTTSEFNLPAPFVMARAEGSSIPVIENISEQSVPGFLSPAIKLQRNENEATIAASEIAAAAPRTEGLRFEAPQLADMVLTLGSDGAAALRIPATTDDEFATPLYDTGREPLVIRFRAPEPAPTPAPRQPLARTEQQIAEPQLRATITSTSSLETVSPWRYADEFPAPPAPVASSTQQVVQPLAQPDAPRTVVVSTASAPELLTATPLPELIEESETAEVRVERGDSLWKLALRHLGDGNAWPQIAAANPQLADPHHIRAGEMLTIPGAAAHAMPAPLARASKPVVASTDATKSVTIRKGDSLWKLAESALGSGAAWSCIADANPQIVNADHILAGQTLVLPTNCNPQS